MLLIILNVMCLTFLLSACGGGADVKAEEYKQDQLADLASEQKAINQGDVEAEIFSLINAYRVKKGLPRFKGNAVLDKASFDHSTYMRDKSNKSSKTLVISHDKFSSRTKELQKQLPFSRFAENVGALAKVDEKFVASRLVEGWINSPGHHKNIVGDYDYMGVGVVDGKDFTVFGTQIFAK